MEIDVQGKGLYEGIVPCKTVVCPESMAALPCQKSLDREERRRKSSVI